MKTRPPLREETALSREVRRGFNEGIDNACSTTLYSRRLRAFDDARLLGRMRRGLYDALLPHQRHRRARGLRRPNERDSERIENGRHLPFELELVRPSEPERRLGDEHYLRRLEQH